MPKPKAQTPAPTPVITEPEPIQPLAAVTPVAATPLVGAIDPAPAPSESRGPGTGDGADGGKGPGTGGGNGAGAGPGQEKGIGGGWYQPGNGVSSPKLLNAVRPNYTADAMRARITGSAWLECVVDTKGRVDRCRVSRSLDTTFGLDQEALKAAQKWTFEPGTRAGEPVPVQVTIELAFSLR